MREFVLTLTEEQARLVAKACEFYTRMRIGQFGEVLHHTLETQDFTEDWCARRESAAAALLYARSFIYPELHGPGHSYGLGKFEDADMTWDVHQALRFVLDGKEPFSYDPIPEVTVVEK